MKYIKKPIEVNAIKMTEAPGDILQFILDHDVEYSIEGDDGEVWVTTVDGNHVAVPFTCYLVIDQKGFPYPCDAEIFEATHEDAWAVERREKGLPPPETCLHRLAADCRTASGGFVVLCAAGCDSTLDFQFIREFDWDFNIDGAVWEQRKRTADPLEQQLTKLVDRIDSEEEGNVILYGEGTDPTPSG